jgi:hypothetical protein
MTYKNEYVTRFLLGFLILSSVFAFKAEKDFLHKRKFNISLDEVKDGVAAKKTIPDLLTFKDGKVFSDYINKKYGYDWIRYRINKDSVFIDSTETEVRMLEVEGSATDLTNQTVIINFVLQEWDIDGTIKITKNDKIKRFFDFVGREKGGKPKKQKSDKQRLIEVKKDGEGTKTETLTPPPPPNK